MVTLGDLALAKNTGITEYEHWPEAGQYIAIPDMDGDLQPYEIVEAELDVHDTKIKRVECEHLYYELGTSNIRDYSLTNAIPATFMAAALDGTRWQVGMIDGLYSAATKEVNRDYCSALEALRYAEREWGARLKFRAEIQDGASEFYVDLLQPVSEFQGVRFEFGRNLEGIRIKVDRRNIVTKLHGFGMGDEVDIGSGDPKPLTFESITGTTFVTNEHARMLYGRYVGGTRQHIEGKYESSAETEQGLLWATQTQLERRSRPSVHIEATIRDLERARIVDIKDDIEYYFFHPAQSVEDRTPIIKQLDHERIRLHDTVYVLARDKGVLAEVIAEITRIERHLKEPESTRLEIGDPLLFGSDEIREIESKVDWKDKRRRKLDRGRGPATITIASEDTSRVPWYADIIVPAGAQNAQEYINDAIDLLPTTGGKVILLEGIYIINGGAVVFDSPEYLVKCIELKDHVKLEGQGSGSIIQFAPNLPKIASTTTTYLGVYSESAIEANLESIKLAGAASKDALEFPVFLKGADNANLYSLWAENTNWNGFGIRESTGVNLDSCTAERCNQGIYLFQVEDATVTGCITKENAQTGMVFVEVNDSAITDITSKKNGREGIRLLLSQDNRIHGCNVAGNSQEAHNTYDNIISSISARNSFQNNTVRKGAGANKARYGINIDSMCSNELVTNNDVLDGGETAEINNDGTGTKTDPGNRT